MAFEPSPVYVAVYPDSDMYIIVDGLPTGVLIDGELVSGAQIISGALTPEEAEQYLVNCRYTRDYGHAPEWQDYQAPDFGID